MSQVSQKPSKTLINGKSVKTFMKKGNMNPKVINAILKGVIPPLPRYVLNKKTKEIIPIYQGKSNKITKEFRNIKRKTQIVFPTNTFYDMKSKKIINRSRIFTSQGVRAKAFKDKKIVGNRLIIERKKKKVINTLLVSYTLKALVTYDKNLPKGFLPFSTISYLPYSTTRNFEMLSNENIQKRIKEDVLYWIRTYYTEGIFGHYFKDENDPTDHIQTTNIQTTIKPQTVIDASEFLLNASTPIYLDITEKEEWNTGKNKCVYDFIEWRYGDIKGCIKICKFEKLWELFNRVCFTPLLSEEEYYDKSVWEDYNTEYYDSETGELEEEENDTYEDYVKRYYGVSISGLKRFCSYLRIPMYALNQDNKMIEYFYPKDRREDRNIPPLCYKIVNSHLYPITAEGEVKSIAQKHSAITNCVKQEEKEQEVKEVNIIELYNEDPYEHIVKQMKERNIQVINENVKMNGANILSYQIQDDKYIFINDTDDNYGKRFMNAIGQNYQGEHITTICSNYIKEKVIDISIPNHIVNELLFREGVKHRTHLGIENKAYKNTFFANYGKHQTIIQTTTIEREQIKQEPVSNKPLTNMELFLKYRKQKQETKIIIREEKEVELEVNWDEYSCYDINKCYSKCITDPYENFIIYDYNAIPQKYSIEDELPLGLFFVKTNDTTLFHKSNIYSTSIVKYGLNEGIIEHNDIEWFIEASRELRIDYFKDLFDTYKNDSNGDIKLNKMMNNLTTGLLGKSFWRRSEINISNSLEEAFAYLQEKQDMKCFVRNCEDIFIYGNKKEKQLQEHNIPIYIQILDDSNIRLYEMNKKCGGELIYRKTDCIIVHNGKKLELGNEWGQYSNEEFPLYMINNNDEERNVNGGCSFLYSDDYGYNHITEITDSSDWKKIATLIESENGLMINGDAGTGKSYVIKNVYKYFTEKKMGVAKLCFTNKGAINIGGQTIHKFLGLDDKGRVSQKKIDTIKKFFKLIIIDEVSMVSSFLWKRLYELKKVGLKFLLVGDWKQIPPVEPNMKDYDYMEHPAVVNMSDNKLVVLEKIHRYDMKLKKASMNIMKLKTNHYGNKICKKNICYMNKTRKYVNKLVNDLISKDNSHTIIPVNKIKVGEDKYIDDPYSQEIKLHKGVPLIARLNDKEYDIVNNEEYVFNIFKTINNTKCVELQSIRPNESGEPEKHFVSIPVARLQTHFAMGYCITTHKAQGSTIDGNLTIWDWENMDKRLRYTAITRATNNKNIHFRNMTI